MIPLTQTTYLIVMLVCLCACVWGARYERKGAVLYGLMYALNGFILFTGGPFTAGISALTSVLCLIGFVSLCWKSRHPWPLWATAAQMVALTTLFLQYTNPRITPATADIIQLICVYVTVLSLLTGTIYMRSQRSKALPIRPSPPRSQDNSPNIG